MRTLHPQTIEQPPASGNDDPPRDADQTADGPARAARVRAEVLVPLRALTPEAGRYLETWSAGLTGLLAAGGQPTGTTVNP